MVLKFVCFFLLLLFFVGCVFEQKSGFSDVGFGDANNSVNSMVGVEKKIPEYDPFVIVHDDFLKIDVNDFG
jgi:hypothetical protein